MDRGPLVQEPANEETSIMATKEQIDSFHQFASSQVGNGGAELSMEQLFDLWQVQNPSRDELTESVAALNAAHRDMENGDSGRPVEDVVAELRTEAKIPAGK